jgi:Homing endonuclease associated repeat
MIQALVDAAYEPGRTYTWDRRKGPVGDKRMLSRRQYQDWVNRQPSLKPSASLISQHFGSWSKALEIAGLQPWHAPEQKR